VTDYWAKEEATIEKVKEALLSLGEVLQETEAIGIFGSLARGEGFTEHSDIDVFVVVKEVKPGFETDDLWYRRVREVLRKFWRGVTVLVYTVRDLEAISNWHVLRLAVEGILVYDQGGIGKLFEEIIEAAEKAGLEQRRIRDRWVWTIKDMKPGQVVEVKVR